MRIFKKISALIAAVAIFGSTVLAGDLKFDNEIKVAADATQVTVNVYSEKDLGMFSTICIEYNKEVYTFNKAASSTKHSGCEFNDTAEGATFANTTDLTHDADPLFTLVFDVNSGKNPVGTSFSVLDKPGLTCDILGADFDLADISITVTSSAPPVEEEPETGDIVDVDGKTAVIDDAGKTRFVVSATETNIPSTTAASVLKVTYAGTTKQANLYKLLGVEDLENAGTLTIGSLTVKVILGEDVTEASQVGAVSFVIQ